MDPDSGEKYVVLLNLADEPQQLSASVRDIWPRTIAGIDLWEGGRTEFTDGAVTADVAPHGCAAFRIASTAKPWEDQQ